MKKALILSFLCVLTVSSMLYFVLPKKYGTISSTPFVTLGFIHAVDVKAGTILSDHAVWLTGKEGEDAAIAAGVCTEETRVGCLPNDFFILNASTSLESLPLDPNVKVTMQTWKMEEEGNVVPHTISLEEFGTAINGTEKHWRLLPYKVTTVLGVVTHIEEVYVP